jgi:hypothetical protein
VGIVDADALPTSEKLNPAAPSAFTVAALVLRFCFEACLTSMVASSVSLRNRFANVHPAKPARKGKSETSHRVPFICLKEIDT